MTGTRAALAAVLLVTMASCGEEDHASTITAADLDEAMGTAEVVYQVEGLAPDWLPKGRQQMRASVTVTTPTGSEQVDVWLPLTSSAGTEGLVMEFDYGEFVYVSAQNDGEYGSVTCRILVDGQVVSENTSSGAYGIATCKGST